MAIRFIDEEEETKPKIRFLDEAPNLTPTGLSKTEEPSSLKKSISKAAHEVLPVAGMLATGIPTAIITAPATPIVQGAATLTAGGAGYAAGENLADILDQLIDVKPTGKFFSLPTKEQVKSDIQQRVEDLKTGVMLEAAGGPIAKGVELAAKATLTGASKVALKGPEYLQAVRESAQKLGIDLTPAEVTGSKALSVMESILDNLPWTAGIIQKHRLSEMQKINNLRDKMIQENGSPERIEELGIKVKNMADSFMQKVGTVNKAAMTTMKNRLLQKMGSKFSYEDLDISAKEAVQRYQQELNNQVSAAYDAVSKQFPEHVAVPSRTIEVANRILKEAEEMAPSLVDPKLVRTAKYFARLNQQAPKDILTLYGNPDLNPTIKRQLEQEFPELLNTGTEKSYQELISNLKGINQEKFSRVNTTGGKYQVDKVGKDYSDFAEAINEDLTQFAKQSGNDEIIAAQEIANQLYKKKLALFEDPAFKAINNKYPGAVSKSILQSGNSELIVRYRALTGEPLFNKAKERLTNDVLGLGQEQTVIGDDIRKRVVQLGESARSIYSTDELNYFKKLADAVDKRTEFTADLISNPVMKNIINKGEFVPEGIAKAIVKPGNTTTQRVVKHFFGDNGVKKVADAFLPDLLAQNQHTKDFMPQTFSKQFNEYGYETLEAWYGKEFATKLKDLAAVGERMGAAERLAGNPSGTGRFMITFNEARRVGETVGKAITSVAGLGGAAGVGAGHYVLSLAGEGSLILGSRQLAKLYTSPAGRKFFVDGLITPQTAKQAGELSKRMLQILAKPNDQ